MYQAWSPLSSIGLALSLALLFLCEPTKAQTNRDSRLRGQGVVTAQDERGQTINLYTGSYALVIGVSDYTAGWRNLPGVKQDVEAVSGVLREHGFQVSTLMSPTRAAMTQAIEDFISRYGEQSEHRLLFYFAGHGATLTTPDGRRLGYLAPADAPLSRDSAAFKRTAISMQMIDNYAQQIVAKHVLFVFDSCFSGMIFQTLRRSGTPPVISLKAAQPVRQFITAGTAAQEVPDQSIFRQYFIKGLQSEADLNQDGYIVGTELGDYLEAQVTNYSRNAQTPQFGKIRQEKLDQGDFIFVSPKGQRKPIVTVQPGGPSQSVTPTKNPNWKIPSNGFIVDLSGCKRARSGVICQFTLTNDSGEDIEAGILGNSSYGQSRLVDEADNEHIASDIKLGSRADFGYAQLVLIPKIAMKASLSFDSVGQTVSKINLLRVACYHADKGGWVYWKVDFRDIPIMD